MLLLVAGSKKETNKSNLTANLGVGFPLFWQLRHFSLPKLARDKTTFIFQSDPLETHHEPFSLEISQIATGYSLDYHPFGFAFDLGGNEMIGFESLP